MTQSREPTLIRHEVRARLLQVVRVTKLSPRMVRVTLGGEELDGFTTISSDDHVRLLFPAAGQDKPVLPTFGPNSVTFPEGATRPVTRDYTPRRFDEAARELDIDFALHGAGVASDWAANAQVGQWLGVAGPRGSRVVPYEFDWYLLAGDESALPSLARRLEELPLDATALAVIEVADAAEILPLQIPVNARVQWVFRSEGQSLENAVRGVKFLDGEYFAWVTGEVGNVRAILKFLLEEKGAPRQHIKADGYWKRGTVNHDHHQPIEA